MAAVFTSAQFHHICVMVKRAEGGTKEIAGGGHLLRGAALLLCTLCGGDTTQHQTQDQQLPNIFISTPICSDYTIYTHNTGSAEKISLVMQLREHCIMILKTKMKNALRTHLTLAYDINEN